MSRTRQLHYILIESLNNPDTDPVIVMFNGGPGGASSFMPFRNVGPYAPVNNSNELTKFNLSWSRNASLLFIDNPSGVGFSYAKRP